MQRVMVWLLLIGIFVSALVLSAASYPLRVLKSTDTSMSGYSGTDSWSEPVHEWDPHQQGFNVAQTGLLTRRSG
jgi:hypothetical protein